MKEDLRGALRGFRRNRGFAAAAVLLLAFGIGTATAVFSVAETLLLRSLPYPDSERLVALRSVRPLADIPDARTAAGHSPNGSATRPPSRRSPATGGTRWT